MPISFDKLGLDRLVRQIGATMSAAASGITSPSPVGIDPAAYGAVVDHDASDIDNYGAMEDDTQETLSTLRDVEKIEEASSGALGGVSSDTGLGGGGGASTATNAAAMEQAMLEHNVAQQQAQKQAMYQQMLNQQQQQAWQQAMAQQQYAAQMAQMNMAAQQQAMAQASQSESLSVDEIADIVAELYADDGNLVEGYDDGENGEGSRRTLEAADVDALDPSEVSLEKVSGGEMSQAELEAVINEAADLNGISDDPEIRQRFINVWSQMSAHESGHNPNAANGWDSNAVGEIWEDGYPAQSSRGPWQTIPDTFAAHHVAGTSTSIYDPTASAAASIRYTMSRYDVGPNGENLDAFAANRGIDPDSGEMVGGYVGY